MIILTGDRYMSWINDVKTEIKALDLGKKKLRNFGLLVGGIFLLISAWIFYSQNQKLPGQENYIFVYIFLFLGAPLFILGAVSPALLKPAYRIWMGLAFAMGWIMSRLLITILFYLVVTPTAFIAKIFRKKFLDISFRDNQSTYWVLKSGDAKVDYKKMY